MLAASYDALAVLVPDCAPTLAVTRRVALTPCPAVHTSDVSDIQARGLVTVLPMRVVVDVLAVPKLTPCIVWQVCPVTAVFRVNVVIDGES